MQSQNCFPVSKMSKDYDSKKILQPNAHKQKNKTSGK